MKHDGNLAALFTDVVFQNLKPLEDCDVSSMRSDFVTASMQISRLVTLEEAQSSADWFYSEFSS